MSSAVLNCARTIDGVDWVVSKEFAPLLAGHPRIKHLWSFDRKTGLGGWIHLCRELWEQDYSVIFDLHSSLRTRLARILFWIWSHSSAQTQQRKWYRLTKQRLRLYGYFVFKGYWPKSLRPRPMRQRFSELVGGMGNERPDLSYLLLNHINTAAPAEWQKQPYLCLMPGSRWAGKCWSSVRFLEVCRELRLLPVVLGCAEDVESVELVRLLENEKRPFVSGVGKWSIPQVATVLAKSKGYLGVDTGLAHLAEAMGVQSVVVFGPTVPDMGFGPCGPESRSIGKNLWCRPCGKDGRYCFRPQRYLCLKTMSSLEVLMKLPKEWVASSAVTDNSKAGI